MVIIPKDASKVLIDRQVGTLLAPLVPPCAVEVGLVVGRAARSRAFLGCGSAWEDEVV